MADQTKAATDGATSPPPPYPGGYPPQSGAYPQQPDAYAGQHGAYPQQPDAYAGQPGAYPQQPGDYAGQPGAYPQQPGDYAGQPGAYPQQPGDYAGQPGAYPQQPGAYPPVTTTTNTVVMSGPPVLVHFGDYPCMMTCPNCHASISTRVEYETGALAWILCVVLGLLGFWLCCFIPLCIDGLKNPCHYCPNCQQFLGRYNRM